MHCQLWALVGLYIDRVVLFQVMSNEVNCPQVDLNQFLERTRGGFVEMGTDRSSGVVANSRNASENCVSFSIYINIYIYILLLLFCFLLSFLDIGEEEKNEILYAVSLQCNKTKKVDNILSVSILNVLQISN